MKVSISHQDDLYGVFRKGWYLLSSPAKEFNLDAFLCVWRVSVKLVGMLF